MSQTTSTDEVHPITDIGSVAQHQYTVTEHGINVGNTVAASGNVQSNLMRSNGYKYLAVGVQSTQAGSISIQRYIDQAGTIPQGPAITAALSAGVANVANAVDNNPFQSFKVTISNSGGSAATLSNLAILAQAG